MGDGPAAIGLGTMVVFLATAVAATAAESSSPWTATRRSRRSRSHPWPRPSAAGISLAPSNVLSIRLDHGGTTIALERPVDLLGDDPVVPL